MNTKLLQELPSIGSRSMSDQFHSVFSQPQEEKPFDIREWTFEQYVEECCEQGRSVRYSKERFEELIEAASRGIE